MKQRRSARQINYKLERHRFSYQLLTDVTNIDGKDHRLYNQSLWNPIGRGEYSGFYSIIIHTKKSVISITLQKQDEIFVKAKVRNFTKRNFMEGLRQIREILFYNNFTINAVLCTGTI